MIQGNNGNAPEWAIDRALALREANPKQTTIQVFARYIAVHEDPPADPLQEVVEEVMEAVFWKMGAASWNAEAFAAELRKRGVTVGNTGDRENDGSDAGQ